MNNEEAWYRIYDDQPENETQPYVVCFFWKLNVGHHPHQQPYMSVTCLLCFRYGGAL